VHLGTEHPHGAVVDRLGLPRRGERLERRLTVRVVADQTAEDVVGEVDHGARRPEVGRQGEHLRVDLGGGAEVLGDVGAAETVDRLFGVADDEQTAGERTQAPPRRWAVRIGEARERVLRRLLGRVVGVGGETHRDLELDGVGVLELVEENPLVTVVEDPSHPWVFGHEPPGEHEEVVERESPGRGALFGGVEHEPAE
jgi:hypothetical protein